MFKKSAKIITLAIVVATMAITTTTAFAAETKQKISRADGAKMEFIVNGKKINPLQELKDDGTIDQKTYDAITAYLKESRPKSSEPKQKIMERKDILGEMLKSNVITQAEYDTIKAATPAKPALPKLPEKPEAGKKVKIIHKSPFEDLLKNGTITQATYDKIKAYMDANTPKIESKAKIEHKDMFADMLEKGVITQTQYDAIKAKLPNKPVKK